MKKKLLLFTKVLCLLSVSLVFSSCEGDKYYEDPSTNWTVIDDLKVESANSTVNNRWKWDGDRREFYCILSLPELSEFIYDKGTPIGYVFLGEYDVNETQVLLPLVHRDGMNISFDVSYDDGKTVCFYFHWDDYANIDPGAFFFKLVLLSGDPNKIRS